MAYYKFAESILAGRPIDIYGGVEQKRDFTYIDDVVEAVVRVADLIPVLPDGHSANESPASSRGATFESSTLEYQPVSLPDFVQLLERSLGRTAACREWDHSPAMFF